MNEVRERHNITISPSVWNILEVLKKTQGKSISEIIESSVKHFVKKEGYNSTYFKIMLSADGVSDKEQKELTKLLDSLKDEDHEVVESYRI